MKAGAIQLHRKQRVTRSIRSDEVPAELYDELEADAKTLGVPATEKDIIEAALRYFHETAEVLRSTAQVRDRNAGCDK